MLNFEQPSVRGLIDRMTSELAARAVVLLHEDGQVLQKSGWIDENEYPLIAALVAAMIATGRSLGERGDGFAGAPSRFACDSEATGLYVVAVANGVWLAVLYEQPLNPGQLRMKIRRYSELLAHLGVEKSPTLEVPQKGNMRPVSGATLSPVSSVRNSNPVTLTQNGILFGNITDDEIDHLFENARS